MGDGEPRLKPVPKGRFGSLADIERGCFMSAPGGEADAIGVKADIGARPGGHDDFVIADALAVWLGTSAGGVATARGGQLG